MLPGGFHPIVQQGYRGSFGFFWGFPPGLFSANPSKHRPTLTPLVRRKGQLKRLQHPTLDAAFKLPTYPERPQPHKPLRPPTFCCLSVFLFSIRPSLFAIYRSYFDSSPKRTGNNSPRELRQAGPYIRARAPREPCS